MAQGKMIPLAIVDTSPRPDVAELIRLHEKVPPGDAITVWGVLKGDDGAVVLFLKFIRPMELQVALRFELIEYGLAVDLAIRSRLLLIRSGKKGDRYSSNPEKPGIFVEIGAKGFGKYDWEDIWLQALRRDMRKRGLGRQQAKAASREFVRYEREFIHGFYGLTGPKKD
jgi:hypothetical protein